MLQEDAIVNISLTKNLLFHVVASTLIQNFTLLYVVFQERGF